VVTALSQGQPVVAERERSLDLGGSKAIEVPSLVRPDGVGAVIGSRPVAV